MPKTFDLELPDGRVFDLEVDGDQPTQEQVDAALSALLPKYRVEKPKSKAGESPSASELAEGVFDTFPFNTRESRVARGATPIAIKNTKFYEAFKVAKIGESVIDEETKNRVIKTSDNEFVSPSIEYSKFKEQTPVESGARAASLSLGPTAVALKAGSEAASRMPGPLPVKIGAGIIAGGAAALGARAIQGRALDAIDPETNRLYEAGYETNPTASFVGEVAATAPFMRPGISRLSVRRNVANVAGGAGIGGAIQAASELYGAPEGELMREGAGKRIAIAAATEGVLNRPTRLGRDLGIGNIARQPKPAPDKPSLVTQIDSGAPASEIAGSKDLIRMLGTPDAFGRSDPRSVMERLVNPASAETPKSAAESARTLDLPSKRAAESAVVFEDLPEPTPEIPKSPVRSRIESLSDPTGAPSAEESAKAFDFLPRRAGESAEVFSAIPEQQTNTPLNLQLVKARSILQKEIDEFIGPIKKTARESAEIFDLAVGKSENINLEAIKRNQAEAVEAINRNKAEAINDSFEKVIGVRDPLTFTAQETELAKRLAAADINYAGAEGQAPVLRDFLGQDVVYNGYTGRLTQSDDGKIVVTFPFRQKGGAQEIVIEGAKSFDDVANNLGVYPKNPIDLPDPIPASSADVAPAGVSGAAARAARAAEPIEPTASIADEAPQSMLSRIEATQESQPIEGELEIRKRRLDQTKERLGSRYSAMEKEARSVKRTAKNSFGYDKLNAISSKYGVSISEVLDSVDINRGLGAGIMSSEAGGINPTLLVDAGSTFIGATLGYQVGDTQEERLRNAAIGAAIGAGGSVGARALSRAMSKSPKVVSAIKAKSPNIIQSLKKDFNNLKGDFKKDTADYLFDDEGIVPAQDTPYDNTRILGDGMVSNAMREAFLGMDREMESINPRLFGRLSSYENDRNILRKQFTDQVEKYSSAYRKLITDPSDQAAFSVAVKNGDVEGLSAIAAKYPDVSSDIISAYNDTRSMLNEIYRLLVESGRDVNEVSNFFPRSVGDYKGLSKELGREDIGVLDNAFNEYRKERGINRELDSVEKAKVISQMLGGTFTTGKKPSFLKGRKIEEVTEKISKYYDPDDVALEKYVVKAAQDIINRKYYGNSEIPVNYKDINIEGTFGSVIAEELASKNINATDQKRIVKILQSRREMDRISDSAIVAVTNAMRNLTSLSMLGDVSSSIPQLSDVAITVQNSGLRSGVKGTKNTLSMVYDKFSKNVDLDSPAKGKISLADLAIGLNTDDINQFALNNKGYLAKSTEAVLKRTVGVFDRFGKEALVNSAYDQFKRASSDMNSVEGKRLRSKYGKVFPEDFDQMVSDLNSGQVTARVKLLLVTELSKLQPVLPSSMPMFYARTPEARLLYTLKSFYIRQLNRIRSEGLDKIVKGWRTDNMGSVAEGFAWMGQYLAIMGAANASVDLAKDYLFNRESDPKEIAIANLMKIGGFSKYTALDASRMGWGSAALEWWFPLVNVANDVGADTRLVWEYLNERNLTSGKTYEDFLKESRSVKYTPGFGREIYNLAGKGAEDEKKRQFDASRGIKPPTAAQSIINLIDASYKDDGK
jgi:hypothetical protein